MPEVGPASNWELVPLSGKVDGEEGLPRLEALHVTDTFITYPTVLLNPAAKPHILVFINTVWSVMSFPDASLILM